MRLSAKHSSRFVLAGVLSSLKWRRLLSLLLQGNLDLLDDLLNWGADSRRLLVDAIKLVRALLQMHYCLRCEFQLRPCPVTISSLSMNRRYYYCPSSVVPHSCFHKHPLANTIMSEEDIISADLCTAYSFVNAAMVDRGSWF